MIEKFICFDIGGTKIFKSVVEIDFSRRKFEFLDSDTIENPVDAERIREIVLDYCQKNQEKFDTSKVAISSASIVDPQKLTVSEVDGYYGEEEFSFGFIKKAGFQVILENDGRAFALGEYYFDNNEEKSGLLTLTLGTGIGGGFINSQGQILRGKNGSATEFSNLKMFIDGKWETWENVSAGKGIERIYKEQTGENKNTKEIFEMYKKNDKAKETIKKAQEYLSQGIIGLANIFDPEKIIFGGSISSQNFFVEETMQIVENNLFNEKAVIEWSISKLKAEMNVLGVCALYYV